jgi:hypothetical protein
MPVSYEFEDHILAVHLVGYYSVDDLKTVLTNAFEDPQRPVVSGMLFDLRDSESIVRRSFNDVMATVDFLARHSAAYGCRVAALTSTEVAYGIVRMGGIDLDNEAVEHREFRVAEDALAWLARGRS